MQTTWIVTANNGRARIYAQKDQNSALLEVEDMVNPTQRGRVSDIDTDQLGQLAASKSIKSVGAATQPSGYEPNQTPLEHQAELFVRSLADYLLQGYTQNRYQNLILAAGPETLGQLRKLLDKQVTNAITQELNKDYTHVSPHDLLAQLKQHQT
ncbi:host attachment protein [[Empedobacter] haloabium]|uniref:Host attachment protein n=1 Tax=[Empedobacter] haloabium TaxID=592317 RepID=A0ABZ1UKN6_9BURK